MKLTIRLLGRELLAVHLDRATPEPVPCDRPHREPAGFVAGASLRAELGPNRWNTTTTKETV